MVLSDKTNDPGDNARLAEIGSASSSDKAFEPVTSLQLKNWRD